MANLFQITGNALPLLLAQIPARDDNERITKVQQALRLISAVYKTQMRNNAVRVDWSNPVNQCAYVFLYFVKHSHLVYEMMWQNCVYFQSAWRGNWDIKVCSIGGGPGSDIAGLVAFLGRMNYSLTLRCSVLDLYSEWQRTWQTIRPNLPSRLHSIDVRYHRLNLQKPPPFSTNVLDSIRNADLVTFVKSFSTVCREPTVYLRVLPAIMNEVKPGAFVLFIDNSAAEDQNDKFKRIAGQAGLKTLEEGLHDSTLSLSSSRNIDIYSKKFDYKPLRSCSVKMMLMQKPSSVSSNVYCTGLQFQNRAWLSSGRQSFVETPTSSFRFDWKLIFWIAIFAVVFILQTIYHRLYDRAK